MIESIAPSAPAADPGPGDAKDRGAASVAASLPARPAANSTDALAAKTRPATRLLIDRQKDTGNFVYRVVDVSSGRLLQEIPRQRVEDLKTATDYVPGALIATDV